jgi:hypothetical protein
VETQRLWTDLRTKIDGEGYQAYSPVCRDCENIGRSSNKVLKTRDQEGVTSKKENGSISATKMESAGTVNMYPGLWTEVATGADLRELWGEANYAAFASGLEEDQMDGAEGHIKIVEAHSVGIRHGFYTEGRCVKTEVWKAESRKLRVSIICMDDTESKMDQSIDKM